MKRICALFSAPIAIDDERGHPIALNWLDFSREKQQLMQSLQIGCTEARQTIALRVETATAEALQRCLTLGMSVLHFAGHGSSEYLCFENGRGGSHAIDLQALSELLLAGSKRGASSSVEVAVVNSCYGRASAQIFVDAGVPHVVSADNEGRLRDKVAATFSRGFYLALIAGKTVRQAFEVGKAAVANDPDTSPAQRRRESDQFVLLPECREGEADVHDCAIFSAQSAGRAHSAASGGRLIDETPPLPKHNLPTAPHIVGGRELELFRLLDLVLRHRLVTVTGAFGSGKSTLAVAAAHYCVARRCFKGVFYLPLRRDSLDSIWKELEQLVDSVIEDGEPDAAGSCRQAPLAVSSESYLIVLDDCEKLLAAPGAKDHEDASRLQRFQEFLGTLLKGTAGVTILLTSSRCVGKSVHAAEYVLSLRPLEAKASVELLLSRSHTLQRLLLDAQAASGRSELRAALNEIGKHPLIGFLAGNPYAISLAANLLGRLEETGALDVVASASSSLDAGAAKDSVTLGALDILHGVLASPDGLPGPILGAVEAARGVQELLHLATEVMHTVTTGMEWAPPVVAERGDGVGVVHVDSRSQDTSAIREHLDAPLRPAAGLDLLATLDLPRHFSPSMGARRRSATTGRRRRSSLTKRLRPAPKERHRAADAAPAPEDRDAACSSALKVAEGGVVCASLPHEIVLRVDKAASFWLGIGVGVGVASCSLLAFLAVGRLHATRGGRGGG